MKKFSKILVVMLALIMVLSFAACTKKEGTVVPVEPEKETADASAETNTEAEPQNQQNLKPVWIWRGLK